MLISVELIDDTDGARRLPADPEAEAAMIASVRARGVLEPITVTTAGNRYKLRFGRRRLRAARACGLTEIRAEIVEEDERTALIDDVATNTVRAPMHPVDQWRAIVGMQEHGHTLSHAAAAIGIDERMARRLDKLGRLHPDVLAAIEAHGMPAFRDLAVLANVSPDAQARALKAHRPKNGEVRWWDISVACKQVRLYRADAAFDVSQMEWEEDLFAEPDSREQFSTTDRDRFMELQKAAAMEGTPKRSQMVDWDEQRYGPKIPKGFQFIGDTSRKPKSTETLFVAVSPIDGRIKRWLAEDVAAVKAAEKKAAERTRAKQGADADGGAGAEPDAEDGQETPVTAATAEGYTRAALEMVANVKTAALRETLRSGIADLSLEQVIALLVLAWTADNVQVDNVRDASFDWERRKFRDLAAQVLLPGGQLEAMISASDARRLAGELLARVLSVSKPGGNGHLYGGSGNAAEWIGAAIYADQALPRFDTAEFLAQVKGDELRVLALGAEIDAKGAVKVVRERLAGQLPNWRPAAAAFGAAAPVLQPPVQDDGEDEEREAA